MRKFLLAAVCAFGAMSAAQNAYAIAGCDLQSCAVAINIDPGVTGQKCEGYNRFCKAGGAKGLDYCNWYLTTGSCRTGYILADYHIDGRLFCTESASCALPSPAAREEILQGTANGSDLAEVFNPNFVDTYGYFGYVNGVNRSGSLGRTTSAPARLDACLGNTNVDALGSGYSAWAACLGNSVGCDTSTKNDYCNATGINDGATTTAAVCKDRCDCVFGYGTCQNL